MGLKSNLKRIKHKFLNFGIDNRSTKSDRRRIVLFNTFCLTWYAVGGFLLARRLFEENALDYILGHSLFIVMIAVAQYVHSKKLYLFGRVIYIFCLWLVAFVFANFIDKGSFHEFFYVIAPLVALLFIDNKYVINTILLVSIFSFALPNYYLEIYDIDAYNDMSKYLWFIILFVIVNYFKQLSLDYEMILEKKTTELEELNNFQKQIFTNLTHEFRTPLTVIQGLSTHLEQELTHYSEIENIRIIHKNASLLNEQLKQILAISALDKSKLIPNNIQENIVVFIKTLTQLFSSYATSQGQTITFISDVDEIIMDFDSDKIQSILQNLISNALKFNRNDGEITVKTHLQNNSLVLSVSDTGMGIEKAHLDKIFDRFYTSSTETNTKGTGIGLAYVKELVNLANGKITVQSIVNKGTTFTIHLPITQVAEKPEKKIQPKLPFVYRDRTKSTHKRQYTKDNNRASKKTILVVEDNKDIQIYYKQLLQNQFGFLQAYNGKDAMEVLKSKNIDLIICDLAMPEMDGFQFSKHLKSVSELSHIPLIIVSANVTLEAKTKSFDLGIDAYLTKPFREEELLSIIDNLFEKQQQKATYFLEVLALKKADVSQEIRMVEVRFIKTLQEFALENKAYSTEEIARKMTMSRSKLNQKVNILTGMPVANYVKHIKIEKAKELLKNTAMQVSEIAFQLGYEDPSLFSKIFKKVTGQSPRVYKSNLG